MLLLNAVIAIYAQLDGAASAPCLSDKELARIAGEGKRHLELERHSVTTHSEATRLPFDFSFAPADFLVEAHSQLGRSLENMEEFTKR